MRLAINLATRGRPELLVETLRVTLGNLRAPDTALMVSVDDDDDGTIEALSADVDLMGRIKLSIRAREDAPGAKFNRVLNECPADAYLMMVDYAPHITPGFDQIILEAAHIYRDGICVIYNRMVSWRFPGINAVSARFVELNGGAIYPEDYPFWFVDQDLGDVAEMTGRIVYAPVEIDTSRRPGTQNLRDLGFWTEFYYRITPEREERADRVLAAMESPADHKSALRRSFELTRQRSEILSRLAVVQVFPEVPDNDIHMRLRRRANLRLIERGIEPIGPW